MSTSPPLWNRPTKPLIDTDRIVTKATTFLTRLFVGYCLVLPMVILSQVITYLLRMSVGYGLMVPLVILGLWPGQREEKREYVPKRLQNKPSEAWMTCKILTSTTLKWLHNQINQLEEAHATRNRYQKMRKILSKHRYKAPQRLINHRLAMAVFVMAAQSKGDWDTGPPPTKARRRRGSTSGPGPPCDAFDPGKQPRETRFDSDSARVGIDNRCSACISHDINDFESVHECNKVIKGFGGSKDTAVKTGTLVWNLEDDQGMVHKLRIPNSYYAPNGQARLLSPQHMAHALKDPLGTGETTNGKECQLYWMNKQFTRTVQRDENNVFTFDLAPGFSNYHAFCSEVRNEDPTEIPESDITDDLYAQNNYVSDDSDDDADSDIESVADSEGEEVPSEQQEILRHVESPKWPRMTRQWFQREPTTAPKQESDDQFDGTAKETEQEAEMEVETVNENEVDEPDMPQSVEFDLNGSNAKNVNVPLPAIIPDEEEQIEEKETAAAQLLRIHHNFGHISMRKLQNMAKQGVLPKRLANCKVPMCSACMFAKATKRPWRSKKRKQYRCNRPTRPGEVVSVDQMVSNTPGLVAHMTGNPTTARYKYATVFVDQATRFTFTYLQKRASTEETLEAKKEFERVARSHGVMIQAYHADNGIFKAHGWVEACYKSGQRLTFAGVNAHHQNGMAERQIRELQETGRASLIHANRRWPQTITANLWPYAIRHACNAYNATPSLQDKYGRSPEQLFGGTKISTNPKHWIPFGCPVYVLKDSLQSGNIHHKWKERARIGIYLGLSPRHNRTVGLVLSRTSGLVSPQFHFHADRAFQTVGKGDIHDVTWLEKTGFKEVNPIRPDYKKIPSQDKHQGKLSRKRKRNGERGENAPKTIKLQLSGFNSEDPTKSMVEPRPKVPTDVGTESVPKIEDTISPIATNLRRSRRERKANRRFLEVMTTELARVFQNKDTSKVEGEILCYQACESKMEEQYEAHPIAMKATADPDTMYLHEAMREPDKNEFLKAMTKEIDDQMENGNFTIVERSTIPKDASVLPSVWAMRRKRDIKTQEIKKWKARLNVDGSKMVKGVHYDQTYAPVASWLVIRILMTLTSIHGWHSRQLDYVQAFPQAPTDRDLYIEIPKGMEVDADGDYVLQVHKNVYGGKAAGKIWNDYLVEKLKQVGWKQSKFDDCAFFKGRMMYVLYTDDSLIAGPCKKEVDKVIAEMKATGLQLTDEGDIQDFLGVNIDQKEDGSIHFTQPHLIKSILHDLRLDINGGENSTTPAASSRILGRHEDSPKFDESFNYRRVIGKLMYLDKGSRSDISYITHQCARFSDDPRKDHGKALKWLGKYLRGNVDKGTIFRPDKNRGLEIYVDADFAGNWNPKEAGERDTARSRHGYFVMYCGCPIAWKSQLQSEICLSSTESEYTGLSYALRESIPLMNLLNEMKELGFPIGDTNAKIHLKVFEDNSGALEMAKVHKYRPRTKHLCVKLHHFRDYVERGEIQIEKIDTLDQLADYLTKPVNEEILTKLRRIVMGW